MVCVRYVCEVGMVYMRCMCSICVYGMCDSVCGVCGVCGCVWCVCICSVCGMGECVSLYMGCVWCVYEYVCVVCV